MLSVELLRLRQWPSACTHKVLAQQCKQISANLTSHEYFNSHRLVAAHLATSGAIFCTWPESPRCALLAAHVPDRLNYLWSDPQRRFFNPFDRGMKQNWLEFVGIDRTAVDWTAVEV